MSEERWTKLSAKGFWFYALNNGIVQLGFGGGIFLLTLQYWQDSNFSFEQMFFYEWITDYLIWIPAAIAIGFFISVFSWSEFENKYNNKKNIIRKDQSI